MTVLDPVIFFLQTSDRKKLTLAQVMDGVDCPRKPILRIMDKLAEEGYLEETGNNPVPRRYRESGPLKRNPTWKIVRDLSERPAKRPNRLTVRQKIWRGIRLKKRNITRSYLIRTTGASLGSVEDVTQKLERDGVLKVTGRSGHKKVYALIEDSIQMPHISEAPNPTKRKENGMSRGWLSILKQRAEKVGRAAVAKELGISVASLSLVFNNKYPAATDNIEKKVMNMYGSDGKVVCPIMGEIDPAKCAETWNKANTLGVRGGNPRLIRQYKKCRKCDLRSN